MPIALANAADRCNRRLAKRDQSAAGRAVSKLFFHILYSLQKFTKDGLYHEYIVH